MSEDKEEKIEKIEESPGEPENSGIDEDRPDVENVEQPGEENGSQDLNQSRESKQSEDTGIEKEVVETETNTDSDTVAPDDDEDPIIEELIIHHDEEEDSETDEEFQDQEEAVKKETDTEKPKASEQETEKKTESAREEVAQEADQEPTKDVEEDLEDDGGVEDTEQELPEKTKKLSIFSTRNIIYASSAIFLTVLLVGGIIFYKSSLKELEKTKSQIIKTQNIDRSKQKNPEQQKTIIFAEHNESFILFYGEAPKPLLMNIKLTVEIPKGKENSRSYRLFKDYLYRSVADLKFYKERMSKWDLILVKELHKIVSKWPGKMPVHLKEVTDVEIM